MLSAERSDVAISEREDVAAFAFDAPKGKMPVSEIATSVLGRTLISLTTAPLNDAALMRAGN